MVVKVFHVRQEPEPHFVLDVRAFLSLTPSPDECLKKTVGSCLGYVQGTQSLEKKEGSDIVLRLGVNQIVQCLVTGFVIPLFNNLALARRRRWSGCCAVHQKVAGLIPSQGAYGRQSIDVSLSH